MFRGFHFGLDRSRANREDSSHRLLHLASGLAISAGSLTIWCSGRSQQRQTLRELDDRLLADIGISREAALREADKWFWE